jgi:2-dehydro-3-deoxyphosphooctonate aldolase (KDO 8-P synthase)
VLTDVHTEEEVAEVAKVVDVLQTPAFLCRQTDFIHAVASAGKPVNIKKGQFLAPGDMKNVVDKAREASGSDTIMVCERGASFGYNNLVSDMRSLAIMRETAAPWSSTRRTRCSFPAGRDLIGRAARIRAGARARGRRHRCRRSLHGNAPDPSKALSDGPNAWPLARMKELLSTLKEIDALVKKRGFAEAKS